MSNFVYKFVKVKLKKELVYFFLWTVIISDFGHFNLIVADLKNTYFVTEFEIGNRLYLTLEI